MQGEEEEKNGSSSSSSSRDANKIFKYDFPFTVSFSDFWLFKMEFLYSDFVLFILL